MEVRSVALKNSARKKKNDIVCIKSFLIKNYVILMIVKEWYLFDSFKLNADLDCELYYFVEFLASFLSNY